MSSYFDATSRVISQCEDTQEGWDAILALEKSLVFDVTVCAMFPDFPSDLRTGVHDIVLQHGVYTLPDNAPPADFEHFHEHRLARRDCGFTDHPKWPLIRLDMAGHDERASRFPRPPPITDVDFAARFEEGALRPTTTAAPVQESSPVGYTPGTPKAGT